MEIDTFCSSYPQPIRRHLTQLFETVLSTLPKHKIYSLVLLGSTPRGEISFRTQSDVVDIYSDYEFVIVYGIPFLDEELQLLDRELARLEKQWAVRSPLFHIDYGISSKEKFRFTPPTFWAFEVKRTARIIYGHDARNLLPEVTLSNLDRGALNELILVRLWNMLLCINEGYLARSETEYERLMVSISYARNALDILSILLPYEGALLAGYKSRSLYFENNEHIDNWGEFKKCFEKATRFKLNEHAEDVNTDELQVLFLDGFTKLLFTLAGVSNPSLQNLDAVDFGRIFSERTVRKLRRKYMDFRLFTTYYKWKIGKIGTLYSDGVRKSLVIALLYMHYSLDSRLAVDKQQQYLKVAFDNFATIACDSSISWCGNDSFPANWMRLRQEIMNLMLIWFYGRSRESADRLNRLMGWRDK